MSYVCVLRLSLRGLHFGLHMQKHPKIDHSYENVPVIFTFTQFTLFFPTSYLHSCDPPIIHGNLTCDTIFIQHNGLIKIGSGAVASLRSGVLKQNSESVVFTVCFWLPPQCGTGCSSMVSPLFFFSCCFSSHLLRP